MNDLILGSIGVDIEQLATDFLPILFLDAIGGDDVAFLPCVANDPCSAWQGRIELLNDAGGKHLIDRRRQANGFA